MKHPAPLPSIPRRMARYSAGLMFIMAFGLIAIIGALTEIPVHRLWVVLFWGCVGALFMGWAVGHAAGRLVMEVRGAKPDVFGSTTEEASLPSPDAAAGREEPGHQQNQEGDLVSAG